MEHIGSLFEQKQKEKTEARNFREELINQFIEKIKAERVGTKWEVREDQLKRFKQGIALKINSNPFLKQSWQLEAFLKQCLGAKSFGACFYGSTRVDKK